LDSTFGDNGIKKLEYLSYNTNANSLCLQPNGQILICGSVVQNAIKHMCLFKLSALGEFDGTFGNKGIVQSAHNVTDVGVKVLVQNDEKIIAIGTSQVNGAYRAVIQRWLPDGTADVNYSNGGQRTLQFSNLNQAVATDAVLMPDQNVLISAKYPFSSAGAITRVMSNGQIDYSFGLNGTISNINTESYTALTMADSNQFLVVGSDFFVNLGEEPIIQKYNVVNSIGIAVQQNSDYSIFPNPCSGVLQVSVKKPAYFSLYNGNGQKVWGDKIESETKLINLHHLPNGLYLLTDNFGQSQRILLQR
jgi:uncharacterized delta-60 repeat protein